MDKIRSKLQENTAMITCSKRETWSVIMNNHGVLTIVPTKIFSWQRLLDSHWSLSNLFTYFQSSTVFLDEKWRHLFYGLALQRGSVPRKQCMTCEFLSFGQGDVFLCPSLLLLPDLNMGSKRWKTRYLWNFSALWGGGGG
ncbi:hypothetical protein ES319_D11G136900v1 [Gossypium barbadense]|uniref:Uncharacterized protein n=1 Tax=Gossypium barbadense TaxID=3634 RepID=A0A5J5PBH6_GOSBA|nr:hypothetical protein ES319_D11G136900v1 [Gossypium barbadense]